MMISLKKLTNKHKEKFVILQSIGNHGYKKVMKQGWSPTLIDTLVDI